MSKKKYIDLDKAVNIGYLGDWYQSSIDTTVPPIWTDEHLEELCNDFIVIPKDTAPADVEEVQHGKWSCCRDEIGHKVIKCSECNAETGIDNAEYADYLKRCPFCEAKMDKE